MFANNELPEKREDGNGASTVSGTLNGEPFEALTDADPRIGGRLEVFAAGDYLWIPLEHVTEVTIEPPRRLRDLLWIPAQVRTGPGFQNMELGEVLLPALAPGSWQNADDNVRLGRATVWEDIDEEQVVPVGQKMLLVDGEECPFLEVRSLVIGTSDPAS
jgi:type VI secretion system protein ImpE